MIPQKIDICCAIKSDANATPKIIPKNFVRSPVNIRNAIQDMLLKFKW
jgi:hypothetical protein